MATQHRQAGPTVEARAAHLIVYTLGFLAQAVLALAIFKVV